MRQSTHNAVSSSKIWRKHRQTIKMLPDIIIPDGGCFVFGCGIAGGVTFGSSTTARETKHSNDFILKIINLLCVVVCGGSCD